MTAKKHPDDLLPMGRPSSYKQEYDQRLIDWMASGRSAETFGVDIGVSKDTVFRWIREHPTFSDAYKQAKDASLKFFEDKSLKHLVEVPQGEKINTALYQMIMRNRFGWDKKTPEEKEKEHKQKEKLIGLLADLIDED